MFKYKKYKDMAAIIGYEGNEKIVTIPSEIDGLKVHRIASMTFFCNDDIEEIHFPENVIIENNVIISCDNLKKIYVNDFKTMGNFIEDCEDIEVICDSERTQKKLSKLFNFDWVSIRRLVSFKTFENEDGTLTISNVFIPNGEKTIVIPDYIDGKKVTKLMQCLFYEESFNKVILNSFIKEIPHSCFYGVKGLETIENIDNIEVIEKSAFDSCYNLYLNLEGMKNLKSIGEKAFRYNRAIRSVKINKGIQLSESTFQCMENLKVLDLSDYDGDVIPAYFCQSCGQLEKIILPKHSINISKCAFSYCYELANVENEDSMSIVEKEAFYSCKKLVLGINGKNLKKVGDNAFREVSFREDLVLGDIELEQRAFLKINAFLRDSINVFFTKDYKKNIIPNYLFAYSQIGVVSFDTNIDVVDECAFYKSCVKKLVGVNFKEIKNNVFANSEIEEFVGNNYLEKIGKAVFSQCYKLTKVDLEDTKVEVLEESLFAGTDTIKILKLPKSLKVLSRVFYNTTLGELSLPDGITSLEGGCFRNAKIDKLIIGKNISRIPNACFYGFVGNVEFQGIISEISHESFENAVLESLDLSNSTIKDIPYSCFYGANIKILKLPKTLENVRDYSFSSANIENFECSGNIKYIGTCAFSSSNVSKFNIDFSKVETIGQRAFYYTYMPKEIILNDAYVGLEAFYNNCNLLNVKILGDSTIERKNFEGSSTIYIEDSKLRNKVKNRTYFKLNPNLIQKV